MIEGLGGLLPCLLACEANVTNANGLEHSVTSSQQDECFIWLVDTELTAVTFTSPPEGADFMACNTRLELRPITVTRVAAKRTF